MAWRTLGSIACPKLLYRCPLNLDRSCTNTPSRRAVSLLDGHRRVAAPRVLTSCMPFCLQTLLHGPAAATHGPLCTGVPLHAVVFDLLPHGRRHERASPDAHELVRLAAERVRHGVPLMVHMADVAPSEAAEEGDDLLMHHDRNPCLHLSPCSSCTSIRLSLLKYI
jgi:hypothetical protein